MHFISVFAITFATRRFLSTCKGGEDIELSFQSDIYLPLEVLKDTAATRVFLVRHRTLNTNRIIKAVAEDSADSGAFLEADLLKELHHPGIPVIYDIGHKDGWFYIVEEYIGGQSLSDILQFHNSLSEEFLINTAKSLCDILLYLHTRPVPVLYQDLKPEHIFFFEDRLRLIDFGIACRQSSQGSSPLYGTVGYVAPELYEDGIPNPKTDIFSYGRVLGEIASHVASPLSARTSALITRAGSEDQRERFSSFEEIADFLNSSENIEKKKSGKGILLEDIAIVGAENGVGTTHIAVALTCYLRSRGVKCAYRDCSEGHTVLDMEQSGCLHERDFYGRDRLFLGELELGPGIKREKKEYLLIKDYGTCIDKVTGGQILLVVGGRSWQISSCLSTALNFSARTKCSIICNQGNRKTAGKYASALHEPVYVFPTDSDPVGLSRKKSRLFRHLLDIRSLFS